jgi:uncharacterized RDD family membrane protein YckC
MTKYDTFWPRVFAGLVDGLVLLPVGVADIYLGAPERSPSMLLAWSLLSYSAYWLYSVLLHARSGQTLGKMAMGVRVLDLSEERIPSLKQAFLRDIGYIFLNFASFLYLVSLVLSGQYSRGAEMGGAAGMVLSFAGTSWFLLEVVTMLTNNKRRALHDYIAGTVVVQDVAVAIGPDGRVQG